MPHEASAAAPRAISLFIQMEYYKNGTLADLIQSGTVGASRERDG